MFPANPDSLETVTGDPIDVFSTMTDRELLETVARDIHSTKELIAVAVEQMGPLLKSPMFSMLGKFAR